MTLDIQATDALLVIDMQNDFLPGGCLPVKHGNEIIPGINTVAATFRNVVLTSDWHPADHVSFSSTHPGSQPMKDTFLGSSGLQQPLWPDHCIQNTFGAKITSKLHIPQSELLIRKGVRQSVDGISAFFEDEQETSTGLGGYLRDRGITRIFFCGLALDVCVGFSAIDATRIGFTAVILEDLTRSADAPGMISEVHKGFASHKVQTCFSSSLRKAETKAHTAGGQL